MGLLVLVWVFLVVCGFWGFLWRELLWVVGLIFRFFVACLF